MSARWSRTARHTAGVFVAGTLLLSSSMVGSAFAQRELVEPRTAEQITAEQRGDTDADFVPPADSGRLTKASLSEISRHAVQGGDTPWGVIVAGLGLAAAIAAGVSLHRRFRAGPDALAPRSAFLRYAGRFDLGWRDRWLLWRIARSAKLPTPLTLLVASGTLYHHGRQYAAGLPARRRQSVHRRLGAIQRAVFSHDRHADSDFDAPDRRKSPTHVKIGKPGEPTPDTATRFAQDVRLAGL